MKARRIRITSLLLSVVLILSIMAGCGNASGNDETVSSFGTDNTPSEKATEKVTEKATDEIVKEEKTTEEITTEEITTEEISTEEVTTEEVTTEEATTKEVTTEEITTEEVTTEEETLLSYEIHKSNLVDIMNNMFDGNTMLNETVMFIDYGDVKPLMYYADEIISVTSYDGLMTYTEGVDYELRDGKIVLLENSNIPCITSEVYYNNTESEYLNIEHDGKICNVYWGEGRTMTQWQVNVTYTHSDTWNGYKQESYIKVYEDFLGKLCRGEDVTVFFYGDSIARGANSSSYVDHAPYQPDYTKLFVYALADLFDYKVKHVHTGLEKTFSEDFPTYNMGERRGTITYVNSSVGGKECAWALSNVEAYVIDIAEFYGCDLFVTNFGMNNGTTSAKTFQSYTKQMINKVIEAYPDVSVMIVSSMVSNPYDVDSGKNQILFEEPLLATAQSYTRAGTPCALVCMASMSDSILDYKSFNDYSANNVNHPNDFFMRVYAQTLLQALIGYENMK
jgi:hypothetical protein